MPSDMQPREWALEEFGAADLGDKRINARLLEIAIGVAARPHGTVLRSIWGSAAREGTYRFLENPRIVTDEIERARGLACVKRIEEMDGDVVIAVDQTSFNLPDHKGERGFGSVGARSTGARGVQVLTALVLTASGVPLGVLNQLYWARSEVPGPAKIRANKKEKDHRPPEDRESHYWPQHLEKLCDLLEGVQTRGVPWLQCDRGADIWSAFEVAVRRGLRITVRVYADRQVVLDDGGAGRLASWFDALPTMGSYVVEVPAIEGRAARTATLSVRYGRATVALGPKQRGRQLVPLDFVHAIEEHPPAGCEPLSWKLATTFPVRTMGHAMRVLANYRLRWRVEELHHAFKSGVCNLEVSQLGSFEAFRRWAIIHSSVAARAERIKHLARAEPQEPATVEFTREEIDAAIILRHENTIKNKPPYQPGDTPTIAEISLWIADLGGYMGPRSEPKYGTVPLARGLELLNIYAHAFRLARARDAAM